ncbi:MAG: hypothetical protein ACRDTH_05455 [Pseudonocardiaceae bacterium]
MSEPTSDALSGFDGTQAPEPLADPSAGRGSWRDVAELQLMWVAPVLDDSALREAIAAALDDDAGASTEPVGQDRRAAPAPQAAPQPPKQPPGQPTEQPTEQPKAPDADISEVHVANGNVTAPTHTATSTGAPAGAPSGRHGTEALGRSVPRQPSVSAVIPPAPSQLRQSGGTRPPMAGASRAPAPLTDLRRRIRSERAAPSLRSRSDGGATAFVLTILIIMALLAYYTVTGFLEAISRFFQ